MSAEGARRFFNAESLRQKDKVEAFTNQGIGFLSAVLSEPKGSDFFIIK